MKNKRNHTFFIILALILNKEKSQRINYNKQKTKKKSVNKQLAARAI